LNASFENSRTRKSIKEKKRYNANHSRDCRLVENCIKEGKLTLRKKEAVIASAEKDLTAFKSNDSVQVKPADIRNVFKRQRAPAAPTETRTFRQLEREAPSVLNAMKSEK
jgi:hypothetical protein